MTLDCELLVWFSILFTVISTELSRVHESEKGGFFTLVQSLTLTFFLSFVFITATQIQMFGFVSTTIYCFMYLLYSFTKHLMPPIYKKLYIVDIGIFQAVAALVVYKFV